MLEFANAFTSERRISGNHFAQIGSRYWPLSEKAGFLLCAERRARGWSAKRDSAILCREYRLWGSEGTEAADFTARCLEVTGHTGHVENERADSATQSGQARWTQLLV